MYFYCMQYLILFTLFILFSCADKKENTATEIAIKEAVVEDEVSTTIPIYNFKALSNRYLKAEADTTYVINFWATWCKPCVKELPAFEQLEKENLDTKVKVVLVSLDFPDRLEKGVLPFIEKHNLKSEVVLLDDPDANSWIPAVSKEWSGAIPATLMVKNGRSTFYEQSFTYEELHNALQSNL